MLRVLCRLRMPDQPLYTAKLGSHDQPCLSSFSQGKHGSPIAACLRNMNNKGTASPCLGLGSAFGDSTHKVRRGGPPQPTSGTGVLPENWRDAGSRPTINAALWPPASLRMTAFGAGSAIHRSPAKSPSLRHSKLPGFRWLCPVRSSHGCSRRRIGQRLAGTRKNP